MLTQKLDAPQFAQEALGGAYTRTGSFWRQQKLRLRLSISAEAYSWFYLGPELTSHRTSIYGKFWLKLTEI